MGTRTCYHPDSAQWRTEVRIQKTDSELTAEHLVESLHEQRSRLCASVEKLEHVFAANAIIRAKPTSLRSLVEVEHQSKSAAKWETAAPSRDTHAASATTPDAPERGPAPSGWRFTA